MNNFENTKPSRVKRKSIEQELFDKSFVHDAQFRPKEHKPKIDYNRKPKNNRELQAIYDEYLEDDNE